MCYESKSYNITRTTRKTHDPSQSHNDGQPSCPLLRTSPEPPQGPPLAPMAPRPMVVAHPGGA
jgi:hypothetical protein